MEKYTVDEIKKILQQDVVDEAFIEQLKMDERTSVQKLVKQYENKIQKEYDEFQKFITMSIYENELRYRGVELIAGVDEVGRGPLAGPVVAAAVILPTDCWLFGIDDSKKYFSGRNQSLYRIDFDYSITSMASRILRTRYTVNPFGISSFSAPPLSRIVRLST